SAPTDTRGSVERTMIEQTRMGRQCSAGPGNQPASAGDVPLATGARTSACIGTFTGTCIVSRLDVRERRA
ncbi:MAG TPA: hypothetical protein PK929_11390, partial [Quisquiliibacterium sp.]|nr:hypothetical protein [Quisquiliibacterium sp.]